MGVLEFLVPFYPINTAWVVFSSYLKMDPLNIYPILVADLICERPLRSRTARPNKYNSVVELQCVRAPAQTHFSPPAPGSPKQVLSPPPCPCSRPRPPSLPPKQPEDLYLLPLERGSALLCRQESGGCEGGLAGDMAEDEEEQTEPDISNTLDFAQQF